MTGIIDIFQLLGPGSNDKGRPPGSGCPHSASPSWRSRAKADDGSFLNYSSSSSELPVAHHAQPIVWRWICFWLTILDGEWKYRLSSQQLGLPMNTDHANIFVMNANRDVVTGGDRKMNGRKFMHCPSSTSDITGENLPIVGKYVNMSSTSNFTKQQAVPKNHFCAGKWASSHSCSLQVIILDCRNIATDQPFVIP